MQKIKFLVSHFQGVQYTQLMHPAGKGAAYYHQLSLQEDQGIDMTQVSWDTVPLKKRTPSKWSHCTIASAL